MTGWLRWTDSPPWISVRFGLRWAQPTRQDDQQRIAVPRPLRRLCSLPGRCAAAVRTAPPAFTTIAAVGRGHTGATNIARTRRRDGCHASSNSPSPSWLSSTGGADSSSVGVGMDVPVVVRMSCTEFIGSKPIVISTRHNCNASHRQARADRKRSLREAADCGECFRVMLERCRWGIKSSLF